MRGSGIDGSKLNLNKTLINGFRKKGVYNPNPKTSGDIYPANSIFSTTPINDYTADS